MLTKTEFNIFQELYEKYLVSGVLPMSFKSTHELKNYMDEHLSVEQRQIIKNQCDKDNQAPNDFMFLWNCAKTIPRALAESVMVGLAAGFVNTKLTDSPITDSSAAIGGGTCWLLGRLSYNADKIRRDEDLYRERYSAFNDILKKTEVITATRSPVVFFRK